MFLIIINGLLLVIAASALTALRFVHRNTQTLNIKATDLAAQLIVEREKASIAAEEHAKLQEEADKYHQLYGKVCVDWCTQYNKANKLEKVLEEAALRY
jgi:uncharacterized protein (DUF3084 family)